MMRAMLHVDGWAGQAVVVVRETPKQYRIRSATGGIVKLPYRNRLISGEQTALVSKRAITFVTVSRPAARE